jgi:hypothetical protein
VPPLDAVYLATPILTDRMIKDRGNGRLVPVAYRHFKTHGNLYCFYEVLGAATGGNSMNKVAGGFTLRTADGRIVSQAPPTSIAVTHEGSATRFLMFPLDGLEAGEYELVLDVRDGGSGRTLQSREHFVLEPSTR